MQSQRLRDELSMLEAMYPGEMAWSEQRREVSYSDETSASSFILRLPDGYLIDQRPEVISASTRGSEARVVLQSLIRDQDPAIEMLDAIIDGFRSSVPTLGEDVPLCTSAEQITSTGTATIIVWLHHLLNTNKRKHASAAPPGVDGFTKPGYPGVLLYTGTASAVREHVLELKALNWQAFQVRLELDEAWRLPHAGVVEVESIGEIAAGLNESQRVEFLAAMKIK